MNVLKCMVIVHKGAKLLPPSIVSALLFINSIKRLIEP
jgi:hypothetical protein